MRAAFGNIDGKNFLYLGDHFIGLLKFVFTPFNLRSIESFDDSAEECMLKFNTRESYTLYACSLVEFRQWMNSNGCTFFGTQPVVTQFQTV